MMLKEHLGRDMSSCSSSGFASFPRRKCCSSVRIILGSDVKCPKKHLPAVLPVGQTDSKDHVSAIRKASLAFIKLIKLLSSPSSSPRVSSTQLTTQTKPLTFHLRRGSRKLFKKISSKKKRVESQGTEMATHLASHLQVESPRSSNTLPEFPPWPNDELSVYETSTDLEFELTGSIGGDGHELSVEKVISCDAMVGGDAEDSGAVAATRGSSIEVRPRENKEQCSPVSVLACPFEDEEEVTSTPLRVTVIEPVDLLQKYGYPDADHEKLADLTSLPEQCNRLVNVREIITQEIQKLAAVNRADKLLVEDLGTEIWDNGARKSYYEKSLALAWDWFNKKPNGITLGWDVDEGRRAYLRDLEWSERWMKLEEDKKSVVTELECEVLRILLEESIEELIDSFYT